MMPVSNLSYFLLTYSYSYQYLASYLPGLTYSNLCQGILIYKYSLEYLQISFPCLCLPLQFLFSTLTSCTKITISKFLNICPTNLVLLQTSLCYKLLSLFTQLKTSTSLITLLTHQTYNIFPYHYNSILCIFSLQLFIFHSLSRHS